MTLQTRIAVITCAMVLSGCQATTPKPTTYTIDGRELTWDEIASYHAPPGISEDKWTTMSVGQRIDAWMLVQMAKDRRMDEVRAQDRKAEQLEEQRIWSIRQSIYEKDLQRWYQFYLDAGYTPEEAQYLAPRAARRP